MSGPDVDMPIYDKAEVLARLGGDESLFADMAGMLVDGCDGYCNALEQALISGDATLLRREAHTVKSMLATFSYEAGREQAARLEHLAATGDLAGTETLTREVAAAVRRLVDVFSKELGRK